MRPTLVVSTVVAVLLSSPLAAPAQESTPAAPPAPAPAASAGPGGIYVGAGAGASVLHGGGSTLRIRVGAPRSAHLALGLEAGLSEVGDDALHFYDVGATYFPWERLLFVRGGVGLTTGSFRWGGQADGGNVLAGVGVALGSARGFNVSLNLEGQYHRPWPLGAGRDGETTACAWLGLEWR